MTFIKKNINTIINIALVISLGFSFLYTQSVEAKFTKLKKDSEARITKITKATENYGKKLDEALEANTKVNKSLDGLIASLKAKYVDNKEGQ